MKLDTILAAAAVAVSTAAAAQTTPSSSTSAQPRMPDEPTAAAPAQATTSVQTPGTAAATTSQATTAQPSAAQIVAATQADVKAGVAVYDSSGGTVGKIESVSGGNAVLSTGSTRAQIPISSLGKNDKGLVISMSKAQIDAQGKKSSPKPK